MRDKITEVFFEMGIYAQEHANCLKDVIEVDSFEGNTRLYTGNDEIIPLHKVFISGCSSMLNVRFTGSDASLWHNIYYHYMLDHGI
jgi:glutamate-1-semialdehyde 2,1-aminomutase